MSLRDAYTMAHSARCKLEMAVSRPDRNWRFIIGHATHLDALILRIAEIEETADKPDHASAVTFKGAGSKQSASKTRRRRSPPPPALTCGEPHDDREEDAFEDEEDFPTLTRTVSRSRQDVPELVPSDDSSSSDEDEELDGDAAPTAEIPDAADLRTITQREGDPELEDMYNKIRNCPCQSDEMPAIDNIWPLSREDKEDGGVHRTAVVSVRAEEL
ncbi:hypothetical protein EJ06DRAFT_339050 [Trichodelitschia bisporula]|uniref:Uncharacterized protein n=1 Tax=Trichodelitschia bisporula TaxID=703511 RepID=A0A6G1I2M2_9PEZI|nr:hypothetical protein EJ06DRAFT_339050 [Trichodelitschia bisporula]